MKVGSRCANPQRLVWRGEELPAPPRDAAFARHPCLAEAAAGGGDTVLCRYRRRNGGVDIFAAAVLVVAGKRDGADRTAADAGAAAPFPVIKAVVGIAPVAPWRWRQHEIGDDAAAAMGDPFGRDQGIVEAEGAETGGIGGMALRPGGGPPFGGFRQFAPLVGKLRRQRPGAL